MRRAWLAAVLVACIAGPSATVYAQTGGQAQGTAPKPQPNRVHLGATSVTVVDEHDTVDDVITRLRKAKAPADATEQAKSETGAKATPPPDKRGSTHEDGRAELRAQRTAEAQHADTDRPKDERREKTANAHVRADKRQRR